MQRFTGCNCAVNHAVVITPDVAQLLFHSKYSRDVPKILENVEMERRGVFVLFLSHHKLHQLQLQLQPTENGNVEIKQFAPDC